MGVLFSMILSSIFLPTVTFNLSLEGLFGSNLVSGFPPILHLRYLGFADQDVGFLFELAASFS